jgi:hypothetical protein
MKPDSQIFASVRVSLLLNFSDWYIARLQVFWSTFPTPGSVSSELLAVNSQVTTDVLQAVLEYKSCQGRKLGSRVTLQALHNVRSYADEY